MVVRILIFFRSAVKPGNRKNPRVQHNLSNSVSRADGAQKKRSVEGPSTAHTRTLYKRFPIPHHRPHQAALKRKRPSSRLRRSALRAAQLAGVGSAHATQVRQRRRGRRRAGEHHAEQIGARAAERAAGRAVARTLNPQSRRPPSRTLVVGMLPPLSDRRIHARSVPRLGVPALRLTCMAKAPLSPWAQQR